MRSRLPLTTTRLFKQTPLCTSRKRAYMSLTEEVMLAIVDGVKKVVVFSSIAAVGGGIGLKIFKEHRNKNNHKSTQVVGADQKHPDSYESMVTMLPRP